jgi:hypothetical protein
VDVERFIRPESGEDFGFQARGGDGLMRSQVVGGVVGRADGFDAEFLQNAVRPQLVGGQQRIGAIPDARRARFIQ